MKKEEKEIKVKIIEEIRRGKKRADAGKSQEGGGICRGAGRSVAVLFPGGIGGTAGQQYQRADFQFLRSDGRG